MTGATRGEMTFPEVVVAEVAGGRQPLLCFTIVFHPDMDRVGECARMAVRDGSEVAVSRLKPRFSQPRRDGSKPLSDRYLSRSPVKFQWSGDHLLLNASAAGTSLMLDGALVSGSFRLGGDRLRRGVVIVLARRVVLFMQLAEAIEIAADPCGLVGESPALQRLRFRVGELAVSDAPVLLLGESGTGKELVAKALHGRSLRGRSKLLTINMAAIPAELAAAELFGASRGAYTGADRDKPGYFQQADGATLFMDEIGVTPAAVQSQLLRALESGEVQPAGGGIRTVDVRVISATDANLDRADEHRFNTALRHRLGALEISLPALRERRDDIGRLVFHYLAHYARESGSPDLLGVGIGDPAVVAHWALLLSGMASYEWPGNVRELRNFCRQIILASAAAGNLTIPENVLTALVGKPVADPVREGAADDAEGKSAYRMASRLEEDEVCEAMKASRWEVAGAARGLRVSRPALYKRIKQIPGLRLASDISVAELEETWRCCGGELERAVEMLEVSRAALQQRWRALDLL